MLIGETEGTKQVDNINFLFRMYEGHHVMVIVEPYTLRQGLFTHHLQVRNGKICTFLKPEKRKGFVLLVQFKKHRDFDAAPDIGVIEIGAGK